MVSEEYGTKFTAEEKPMVVKDTIAAQEVTTAQMMMMAQKMMAAQKTGILKIR